LRSQEGGDPVRRTALVVVLGLALLFALAGCSAGTPSAQAEKAACMQNMALIHTEMALFLADSGEYPPLAIVLQKTGIRCPSGGTYSFDADTGTISCSIHGAYKP
jgi:hypothetical protein